MLMTQYNSVQAVIPSALPATGRESRDDSEGR